MNFLKLFILIELFASVNLYASNDNLEQVSIQLEWKHQFEFAGFYAAKEQGYYEDVNLDVQIKEYDKNIDVIEDVISGTSTYGMSSSHLILERLSGRKIVQLASYLKQNALVLITKPEFSTIGDLKNKKIMATQREITSTSIAAMLQVHQLDIDDVEIIPHTFSINSFVNGEVDAMTAFISNQPFLLDQKNIEYNIFNPSEDGIYSYDVELFTSESEAKNYPKRTQNFINATRKGWEYALEHKKEIVELIYKKYSKRKSKEALLYEADTIDRLMKTNLFKIGAVVPELTQLNTDMYVNLGMANKHWDLDGFIFDPKPIQINLTREESDFIKAHPIIRFSDVEWKPFANISKNGYSGIFKEYYKLIEQRTGLKFEFVKIGDGVNFQLVLDALKRKEIDMIDGSGKTRDRRLYALFAGPMMQVNLAIASHKNNKFNTLESLKDKYVAVAKGGTASEYIKENFPYINLLYTDSIDKAISMVANQKVDASIENLVVFDHMIKQNRQFRMIELSNIEQYKFDIYGLIRDDYTILRQIINKAIRSISQEELLEIHNKLLVSTIQHPKYSESTKKVLSNKLSLTDDQISFLKQKGEIKICVHPDWMPLEEIKDGKYIGVGADYIYILQSKLDRLFKLVPTESWSKSVDNIKHKRCDILPMVTKSLSKEEYMDFTKPYITLPLVVATTYDKPFISKAQDLNGKRIGMVKGCTQKELLHKKYKDIIFIDVMNTQDGLQQVAEGKLYGFIENITVVGHQIQKEFSQELKITGRLDENVELRVGARKDEPILAEIMQKSLNTISNETEQSIMNRWVSVKYDQGFDYKLFWYMLSIFTLLALILLIAYYLLNQYNKRLKYDMQQKVEELQQKDDILISKLRMAAMGEMLSMIAHQWRQPLSAINSALLAIDVKLKSKKINFDIAKEREDFFLILEKKHQNIFSYVSFLSSTIDDFRNFFKPKKEQESVKLSLPVDRALMIIADSMQSSGITIRKEVLSDPNILLYQNEVMQVVLNILKNCEDHFKETRCTDPLIIILIHSKGTKHQISICDNGGGVDEEIMDKIFDPYFSTKAEQNGTGLGLYMSKIIIEEHHQGYLVARNVEKGVCFDIIFEDKHN